MGRLGEVVASERVTDEGTSVLEVRCDPGGGAMITAEHAAPPGDDSRPLPGDTAMLQPIPGSGRYQCTGYLDPDNAGQTDEGEVRRYSRSSDGAPVAEIWLKTTGEVLIKVLNATGAITLEAPSVVLDSPDVKLSDTAGKDVARVGDMAVGTSTAVGTPFACQIISGKSGVKA